MRNKLSFTVFFNVTILLCALQSWRFLHINGMEISNQDSAMNSEAQEPVAKKGPANVVGLLGSKRSAGLLAENQESAGCFPMRGGGGGGSGGGSSSIPSTGGGGGGGSGGGGFPSIPGGGGGGDPAVDEPVERRRRRMRMAARKRAQQNARKTINKLIQDFKLKSKHQNIGREGPVDL